MKFTVLTLFPEIPRAFFESSIMAKAVERGIIAYDLVNIRDFAFDRHKTCDDAPYGGGAGQLLLPEPLGRALDSVEAYRKTKHVIYVSPGGRTFTQEKARQLSRMEEIVLICGRYEGIDQRIIDLYVDEEISIGDYVMSSGEVAATVIVDSVYRLVQDVITEESLDEESFSGGLLEYPQYTRPGVYKGMEVPAVLTGGNHEEIRKWRLMKSLQKTLRNRPDLVQKARLTGTLSDEAEQMIDELAGYVNYKNNRKQSRQLRSVQERLKRQAAAKLRTMQGAGCNSQEQ
ncbi:MAG TPA: tRNA (guanosine(37)-N1)-methyltransferase TrmD [Treponema sp.]|nr:tRNA (guanosine(37)-N1)-methyltransferase TrmD [Treponema sp.]